MKPWADSLSHLSSNLIWLRPQVTVSKVYYFRLSQVLPTTLLTTYYLTSLQTKKLILKSVSVLKMPLCTYFKAGRCIFGPRCRNSHDTEPASRAGKVPCPYFAQGLCSFDTECLFSHGADLDSESNTSTPETLQQIYNDESQKAKRPMCMFFPNGKCRNGDGCRFQHEIIVIPDNEESPKLSGSLLLQMSSRLMRTRLHHLPL